MKVLDALVESIGYLAEGSLEIFSSHHDDYPSVGIQPYSGDVYRPHKKSHYSEPVAKISH